MPKNGQQDKPKGLESIFGDRQRRMDEVLGDTGLRRPKKRKPKDAKPK